MSPLAMRPFVVVVFVAILVSGAIGSVLYLARGAGWGRFVVAGAVACTATAFLLLGPQPKDEPPPPVPLTGAGEYVTSRACRSCHPSEYDSWRKTYHRTMTRMARASDVAPRLEDPVPFILDGRGYGLRREGDTIWASLPSPDTSDDHESGLQAGGDAAKIDRRVLLTTGSHHYEAYWVEGERSGELRMFPFVYLLGEEARWMPRRDVFVEPPDEPSTSVHWSSNCIQCHTTAGRPGYDARVNRADHKDPEVAELGVACEACHGPGGAHVQKYKDPIERYRAYARDRADTSLVNPSRLSPERASMICGACHAFTYPRDEDDFWEHGYTQSFRPGQDLGVARILLTAKGLRAPGAPSVDTLVDNLFYSDETVRIGGREYNGMVQSACFQRGEGTHKLSCLSCHSMHDSEPDDQLTHGREGDAACAGCHDRERFESTAHTHHARGSPGSSCLGCHMPMTAYALLKSIRSHRIDSPDARSLSTTDRPNACNLCHVDRSLAWTASRLFDWYGQPASPEMETPAGAAWLIAGDPAQRALAAAAMGEPGARLAAGDDWEAPWLASALEDPYAAVRFIARRSLLRLSGFGGVVIDPSAPAAQRHSAAEAALSLWERAHGHPFDARSVEVLVAARSPRALTLSE
jgi:predicted CXXCH cytochrome family protein